MKRAGLCGPCSWLSGSPWSDVELAELDTADERSPFVLVEFEGSAAGVLGVANLDGAIGKDLDGNTTALVRQ